MPLTHYVITEANRMLHIINTYVAPQEPLFIDLPLGNRSIDEMGDVLNNYLLFGFTAVYLENANTLQSKTESPTAALVIGPLSTCDYFIGVRARDMSVLGSYSAPGGVILNHLLLHTLQSSDK